MNGKVTSGNKRVSIIVDGSMVPDGDTSGVACVVAEDIAPQIAFLSHRYDKWKKRDKSIACRVYEDQIGDKNVTVYIRGEGIPSTSIEIEKRALEYGSEIIKRNKLGKEEYNLYSDCQPNIANNNIRWIKSHMNNPAQELVDLAAKLANLLEAGEELIFNGKIYDLIDKLIEELEERNKKLPELPEDNKCKESFIGEDIFYLKEEPKKGLFKVYYDGDLVYEVISPTLMDLFKLCALKQNSEASIKEIKKDYTKYIRTLRSGDLIKDCREENTWVFFKKDPISKLVIPIYTFKGIDRDKILLRDILDNRFCLYALPSIKYRETTISSTVIRKTNRINEENKDRVICCGSLFECLEASDRRKEYMKIRQDIRTIQGEIERYKKLIRHTNKNTYKVNNKKIVLGIEEMRKLLEICNMGEREKIDIKEILNEKKKELIEERNELLKNSIEILKTTCRFFLH